MIECPTCGKTGFTSEGYMKRHHALAHGESLRNEYICSVEGCDNKSYNPNFCSQKCLGKARRRYEYGICGREGCKEEVYNQKYCSRDCANKESWKNRDNPAKRPEVRVEISRNQKGQRNSFYGESHTEEALEKISEASSGENNALFGLTGEDHPAYGNVSGLKRQKVEETGHTVRSNWEKEIDIMLHNSGLDYGYEIRTFRLSEDFTYTPDFIVGNIVIEVKGWPDDLSKRRARSFMEAFPDFTYLVVGNRTPCDIFLDWGDRDKLVDILMALA